MKDVTEIIEADNLKYLGKPQTEWKGEGFCKARDIREANDYCNNPTEHTYCSPCECSVRGCHEKWSTWNMEYGKFCSKHARERIPR